jgi:hypothetical protein
MTLVVYAPLGVFLILAAKDPGANRSLLMFIAWSSAVHGLVMAGHSFALHQHGQLVGDVTAMFVLAIGPGLLMPAKTAATQGEFPLTLASPQSYGPPASNRKR